jgi:spore germination protein PC
MEIYQYIRELHAFVEIQHKKLRKLEKAMQEMHQELVRIKERPPIQVGNLEYKFDQLKVETLEGTLNIGLNPSDLEGISDFAVDNKSIQAQVAPKDLFTRGIEIEKEISQYLEKELPEIYQNTLQQLHFTADESYYSFIKGDILKQLPNRIRVHLDNLAKDVRENEAGAKQKGVKTD